MCFVLCVPWPWILFFQYPAFIQHFSFFIQQPGLASRTHSEAWQARNRHQEGPGRLRVRQRDFCYTRGHPWLLLEEDRQAVSGSKFSHICQAGQQEGTRGPLQEEGELPSESESTTRDSGPRPRAVAWASAQHLSFIWAFTRGLKELSFIQKRRRWLTFNAAKLFRFEPII